MKWYIVACCLLWVRRGDGSAINCVPDPETNSCITDLLLDSDPDDISPELPTAPSDAECLAGSEWESRCHRCRCSSDGVAQCTRMELCDSPTAEEPIRCKPNTTFARDCNSCACLDNGLGLCTLIACVSSTPAPAPSKQNLPQGSDCEPGSSWRSQCNDCVCSPAGQRFCTEEACPGQETEPLLRCAPHSLWRYECNTCWCTSDGRAMCTKIACVGIPSDMKFSDEDNGESKEKPDMDQRPKPELFSNIIHEPDANRNDFKHTEHTHGLNSIPIEQNLTGVSLKNLEDFDRNDLDTPIEDTEASVSVKVLEEFEGKKDTVATTDPTEDFQSRDTEANENTDINSKYLRELTTPYIGQRDDVHYIIKRSVCKPNQDFKSECNTCKCSASGQSYACTQNECMDRDKEDVDKEVEVFMENEGVDHIESHSVCKPGAIFFVSCNPCQCNADGTDFSCPSKPCPPPKDVEVFDDQNASKSSAKPTAKPTSTKKVCVENRMFIKNCNTCWCNEDGTSYFCTRRVCVPELTGEPAVEEGNSENLRIIKRKCRPNEVFELDCNMCRCNPDGQSFSCTRRACFDEDTKNKTKYRKMRAAPQEPPKSCQPGQEFRMDCNKCLCDNEGQDFSCTRIDCRAQNNNGGTRRKRETVQNVTMECVAGTVFDVDCNICRCTEDGKHAVCSLKRCAAANQNATAPAPESSFRCNPGEQFRRKCNDCSCSADGKTEYCTVRFCADELTP